MGFPRPGWFIEPPPLRHDRDRDERLRLRAAAAAAAAAIDEIVQVGWWCIRELG